MIQSRNIAFDATFMVAYIGFTAAMVAVTVSLFALLAIGHQFGPTEVLAAVLNIAGWIALPFAPHLYRGVIGQSFNWRANGVFGETV